jgi:hypothetical protein
MDTTKPTLEISEHIGNILFDKKEAITETKIFSLEEQMINHSNEVEGIKVISVYLPPNYDPTPKTETQLIDWLENKLNHRNTFAYRMCLKYGEKLKIKLEKKEPYN